jgi:hypothetical protein
MEITALSMEEQLEIINNPMDYVLTHYKEETLHKLPEENPFLFQKLKRKGLWNEVLQCFGFARVREIPSFDEISKRGNSTPEGYHAKLYAYLYHNYGNTTEIELREKSPELYRILSSEGLLKSIFD